jgi:ATP-dependent RNA helicase DeaD
VKSFEELGVKKSFIQGLNDLNIVVPSEIQSAVIPILLNQVGDFIGQAQTGTGKTAAFGLPILQKINSNKAQVQALILCPTRELGQQIAKQLFRFTKYSEKIFTECVYGGAPIDNQIAALRRPTHVIVATPGRLIDLVKRDAVDLSNVHTLVLDEADEMVSMGFKDELEEILSFITSVKEKWLFSATMPVGVEDLIVKYLKADAKKVQINPENVTNKNIQHQYVICDESEKLQILLHFLKSEHKNRGIVFCKTKATAQNLAKQLIAKNVEADALHGDLLQKERDKVMRAFKNENVRILVATDIAARGIDVDNLSFVVHYQLPDKDEYYTHRSGRTARAGKSGISLCIITTRELKQVKFLAKTLNIEFFQIR